MAGIFGVRHNPVLLPTWFPAIRATQLFFALLIIGLTAYSLSMHSASPIHPALVLMIITAVLTVVPVFPLTIPLSKAVVHPVGTLVSDFFATLLWLSSLVALASYLRIYNYYRKVENIPFAPRAPRIARAWRCGVAACVFAAIELLLFLATLKIFAYYYHHHQVGTQPHTVLSFSSGPPPKDEPFALQHSSNTTAAPPATTNFAQQQPTHQQPQHSTSSPPVSPLQPTAHPAHNVPSITTTAATPTAAHPERTNATGAADAFASPHSRPDPYGPNQDPGYASPIIPDPETSSSSSSAAAAAVRASEKARPPYPVDEDEESGVVGKGRLV
ncbi:hypothetical protein GTA08_BOTSDO02839 [Botryosphaeria dothidea]|uniref:MARVEL domain-containing protein n=1 Tax=Botryosphaeria dothidea TaxID=55169 RepID=A0A8H4IXT1_9PEZI|nr:hypothetical protein GTA08_BOTSDO02839 [Botryosphaeria dothidea]